ncbi:hypothetical protein [Oceanotoga teriensis]|uniref:hypothetical protein n=1 Tax=Oceanotoga teriensis TaxID=515440 RepID=UPI00271412F6|nr:hypothetical protein [Oceanotoga teriensis]MDO7976748.1 hypothetical protein [Oceanotoga teriensis]
MNKKLTIFLILSVFLLSITVYAEDQWDTSVSNDPMTGTKTWYANSPMVTSTETLDFPYSDVKAWIGIGYDGKEEWVYIGFTSSPNIVDTITKDGYNVINTRIKWDDKIELISLRQEWGAKFIHFRDDKTIVSKISNSNTVLLELNWYSNGNVYFNFPLEGASSAIDKIYKEFEDN